MAKKKVSKKSRLPLFSGIVVLVLIGLGVYALMSKTDTPTTAIAISPEPVAIKSVPQSLEAYRGKVVILDLWATWCGPCRVEIPDFIKLQNQYGSQGLAVVGVSIDPIDPRGGGGAAAVGPFMKTYGINYNIWTINEMSALGPYQMGSGIPTTYVIDRSGKIVQKYVGVRPMSVFENEVKKLL
jgi:thiol-disulfide isomerase/thioredoxin